jgi:uncharacterized membrane protein YphA (DoxX/SURF4 family)
MADVTETAIPKEGWIARNVHGLKSLFRIVLGLVWLIDGALKFAPGFVDQFNGMISGDGQPAWLQGWFTFWANATASNPTFWVYMTGTLEVALGLALVFGFARKIAYLGGMLLSLFIWAVPEGFGGPYGPGSTDIGTGAVYAMLFAALIVINASYGPSTWSLDYWIEKHYPSWAKVAEFRYTPNIPGPSPRKSPAQGAHA